MLSSAFRLNWDWPGSQALRAGCQKRPISPHHPICSKPPHPAAPRPKRSNQSHLLTGQDREVARGARVRRGPRLQVGDVRQGRIRHSPLLHCRCIAEPEPRRSQAGPGSCCGPPCAGRGGRAQAGGRQGLHFYKKRGKFGFENQNYWVYGVEGDGVLKVFSNTAVNLTAVCV
jgi:hypothetical protein